VVFVLVVLFSVYSTVMHICLHYLLYSCLIMLCHIYVDKINNNNNVSVSATEELWDTLIVQHDSCFYMFDNSS